MLLAQVSSEMQPLVGSLLLSFYNVARSAPEKLMTSHVYEHLISTTDGAATGPHSCVEQAPHVQRLQSSLQPAPIPILFPVSLTPHFLSFITKKEKNRCSCPCNHTGVKTWGPLVNALTAIICLLKYHLIKIVQSDRSHYAVVNHLTETKLNHFRW